MSAFLSLVFKHQNYTLLSKWTCGVVISFFAQANHGSQDCSKHRSTHAGKIKCPHQTAERPWQIALGNCGASHDVHRNSVGCVTSVSGEWTLWFVRRSTALETIISWYFDGSHKSLWMPVSQNIANDLAMIELFDTMIRSHHDCVVADEPDWGSWLRLILNRSMKAP